MWLWFVLGGLLILIAWALKFTLGYATLYPILATVGVVVMVGLIWLAKYLLAYRAAKRLQDAIEQQGTQQAMNARPERRAEIQELRKQLLGGLAAIKKSKLGRGQQRGGAALYTMPWYMIIGPPGAGKTTALTHSGLVFPYGSTTGGGIRGVGGTRNCDWWFTNEAILLDTAGRYTTESDDRDEWISFLAFLRRYRPKRPINGIIIALSISELIDANEMQIEAVGKKLRARIDEVAEQLHMVLPVYLLFTKVDLIAGFSEFFNDMKKSDRSKCWGATIKLDLPKNEPARVFGAEFDVLVKQLHARALKRCVMERGREVREKLYQFPLEFAGLKRNLAELIGTTFQPNTIQGTPIFRGFYFTSGTQEGRPMDRVLERMSAAMGIRAHASQQQQQQQQAPVIESKSYFLHDVFMTVIFPDGDIAVRSASEERRRVLMKVAIAGATFALAAILAFPAGSSYLNNKSFLNQAEKRSEATAAIDWNDSENVDKRFREHMLPTLEHLKLHDEWADAGVPLGMGWGMFVANKVKRPTLRVYAAQMETGFALPCKRALEERLRNADGKFYLRDRTALRQYLMLSSFGGKMGHLDVEWATGRYTQLWAELMALTTTLSSGELKLLARPHVQYYLELIKKGKVTPVELDEEVITKARYGLQAVSIEQRYYEMLVSSVGEERIDNANDPTITNLVFPPVELPRVFPNRTNEILRFVQSKLFLTTKKDHKQVAGQYTVTGHAAVLRQLEAAEGMMKSEAWVVPLSAEETSNKIPTYVTAVKKRYEEDYIKAWVDFFADIQIKIPTSPDEAIDVYREISTVVYPLARLLIVLEENTQWKEGDPLAATDGSGELYRPFLQRLEGYREGVPVHPDLATAAKRTDVIAKKFESVTKFGSSATGLNDSRVYRYAELIVKKLKDEVIAEKNRKKDNFALSEMSAQIDVARTAAEGLLADFDATAVGMLKAILLDPLKVGERRVLLLGTDPDSVGPGPPKDKVGPLFNRSLPKYPHRNP